MTVKELREQLENYDDNMIIVLSDDPYSSVGSEAENCGEYYYNPLNNKMSSCPEENYNPVFMLNSR